MRRSAPALSIIAVLAFAAACSTTEAEPSVADTPPSASAAIETTEPAPEPTPTVKPVEAYVAGDRVAAEDVDPFRNAGLSIYVLDHESKEGLVVDPAGPVPEEIVAKFQEAAVPKIGDSGMDRAWAEAQLKRAGLRGAELRWLDEADYPNMDLVGLSKGFHLVSVGAWEQPDFEPLRASGHVGLFATKEEAIAEYDPLFAAYPHAFWVDFSEK